MTSRSQRPRNLSKQSRRRARRPNARTRRRWGIARRGIGLLNIRTTISASIRAASRIDKRHLRNRTSSGPERCSATGVLPPYALMEVIMRKYFALSVGCLLATALVSVASAADWRQPYIYRETSGSWTNVEYNDGTCHYYYSFNSYDQNMKINRYGDCSHVAIGPDGVARPVVFMAPVAEQRVRVR